MLCAALCLLSAPRTVGVPAYDCLGSMPVTPGMGCLGGPGEGLLLSLLPDSHWRNQTRGPLWPGRMRWGVTIHP